MHQIKKAYMKNKLKFKDSINTQQKKIFSLNS